MSEFNDHCACGHRPKTERHICGITFVQLEARIAELEALLRELIDIEGPQPGNFMWALKVMDALAK